MKKIHQSADVNKLKSRIENMMKAIEMMEKEFVEYMKLAETMSDMSFIIKGNGLKRNSEKTVEELKCIEKEIEVLKEKRT